MKYYYFDNAATSWPKPRSVFRAMRNFMKQGGGNPGRSGHDRSIDAGRYVLKTRELLASLFNVSDPSRIVFTKNATEALNLAICGLVAEGDHVVTSSMEHNSVMRPLRHLEKCGVEVSLAHADSAGCVDAASIERLIKENTKMVILTHASNVTGAVNDIEKVGELCALRGILFLVDAAQTAGVLPIDVKKARIDMLAFSGHKGLLGPQGTGGLYIGERSNPRPLMRGGTGSLSDRQEQPDFLPDRCESGTLNAIGLAGLGAGIEYIFKRGIEKIFEHDARLLLVFVEELSSLPRLRMYGPGAVGRGTSDSGMANRYSLMQTGVLSINIEGLSPSRVGELLEKRYGIQTRIGLHCAPGAHETIGTFPDGTVRLSWGIFTGERDVMAVCKAIKKIAG